MHKIKNERLKNMDPSFESLESMNKAYWYNQWSINQFKPYLKGQILEIGCGIGNFTSFLTLYGKIWAIDINKEYLSKTSKKLKGKAKVGFGDIEKGRYFFKSESFNTIVCLNVLEHIKNDSKALDNIFNLLKKGGNLILLVPAHPFLYGEIDSAVGHFRRYQKNKLLNLLKNHKYEIVKCKRLNLLGAIGWWVTGKLFKKSFVEGGKVKIFNVLAPFFLSFENIIEPPFGTSLLVIAKK